MSEQQLCIVVASGYSWWEKPINSFPPLKSCADISPSLDILHYLKKLEIGEQVAAGGVGARFAIGLQDFVPAASRTTEVSDLNWFHNDICLCIDCNSARKARIFQLCG